jgi:hypothetical protein
VERTEAQGRVGLFLPIYIIAIWHRFLKVGERKLRFRPGVFALQKLRTITALL